MMTVSLLVLLASDSSGMMSYVVSGSVREQRLLDLGQSSTLEFEWNGERDVRQRQIQPKLLENRTINT